MPRKNIIIAILIFLAGAATAAGIFLWREKYTRPPYITPKGISSPIASFEECANAGNPVMESYPRQCRANGVTFAENIGNELEKSNLIQIAFPRPNARVSSPLEITGQARGNWFFEASFPIELRNDAGNIITTGIAQAQDEWMTENFVPFKATLEFSTTAKHGTLVLKKDNPSGLPEYDDALIVPITFP